MPLVEIQGLQRRFGRVKAVDDVSFGFDGGTIFGFIGPNGAGKTTTMRILATLDVPDAGEAWIGGESAVDYPDRIRRKVGFLPDYYGTYPNTSVQDYLDFFGRACGLRGAALRASLEGIVEFAGLGGIRDKEIDTLSKGMKQRLALGRVLIHDPQVLILDEPTAGLDPRARVEFRELLKLLAERGKAILISSHILTELSEFVHACAIIERGRLVCQGSVAEVRAEALRRTGRRSALRVEFLDLQAEAERFLREQPFVADLRGNGNGKTYTVEFEGDAAAAAGLLKALVDRGMPVLRFQPAESTLEDVFMAVTRGEVQ